MLPLLVDCELLYDSASFSRHQGALANSSTVLISSRRALGHEESFQLREELSLYGRIEKLLFHYRLTRSPGVVCHVTYPFLTHAYLASVMVGGSGGAPLSAEIEENGRDEWIVEEARRSLMVVMESYFPR